MYETKWIQVLRSRGRDEDLVNSFTSTTEMLPTTLDELSMTAKDETPSLSSKARASAKGLSPLLSHELMLRSYEPIHLLDSNDVIRANLEVSQVLTIELFDDGEVSAILPEEADQTALTEKTCDLAAVVGDHNTVKALSEDINGSNKISSTRQEGQGLFLSPIFDAAERNGLAFTSLLSELDKVGDVVLIWSRKANDHEEIRIQVSVIECANKGRVLVVSDQQDWGTRRDQQLIRSVESTQLKAVLELTLVAASTGASVSTKRRSSGLVSSCTLMVRQFRPVNCGSGVVRLGGLSIRSCTASCDKDG
jgi:hypothetical protein